MIKVLIVDDSALMRRILKDTLERHPEIEVVGVAENGKEAIEKLNILNPDVITLDVEMPIMNGLDTLKKIMSLRPTPVIMVSALTTKDAEVTIEALMNGAVDFVTKPQNLIGEFDSFSKELQLKILNVAKSKGKGVRITEIPIKEVKSPGKPPKKLVIIGSSTGGPQALYQVMSKLTTFYDTSVVIVQHMPPGFTKSLAERLDSVSKYIVKEAEEGESLRSGVAYVAPGGYHLILNRDTFSLSKDPPVLGVRPSVDVAIFSLVRVFKSNTIGVLLTGMGSDGARGLEEIKRNGGKTIVQDERSCVVFGMPKAAIDRGVVDVVVDLEGIPTEIERMISEL
ncbi:MAG: chemotaxis response regulator protein-glutamate methylesterase [bacterium]|nr:chemotaxis response regulator protein-glutamate methylesterase [bacterium]